MDSPEAADRKLFNTIARDYAQKDIVQSSVTARKYRLFYALDFLLKTGKGLGTILEVGCGVGAASRYLDGTYDKYIGLDHSERLIEYANSRKPNDRTHFLVADLMRLDLQAISDRADLILAVGVLHHVSEPDVLIQSIKKLAGPAAHFVAIEPHRMNPFIRILRRIRKRIDSSYSTDQYYFKPSELMDLLKRNGLTEVSYSYHGFFSTPLAEVILRPRWLFSWIAGIAVLVDCLLDKILPHFLKAVSWSVVVRGRFPKIASE